MATMADTKGRRTRRRFTDDNKTGAVRLVLDEGKTVWTLTLRRVRPLSREEFASSLESESRDRRQ